MTTAATVRTSDSAHWYFTDGRPCYELPKKDGKGMKTPTLSDARKLNLLPSVTTILAVLDKPALNDWKVTQGVLAVITTPRLPGEADDAFVHRVLQVERIHEQEGQTARDFGTDIHDAMEAYFIGAEVPEKMLPWIKPAAEAISSLGDHVATEKILVGEGYAGKTDNIRRQPGNWLLLDYKSTKNLPEKGSWDEHIMQLAAYAEAWRKLMLNAGDTLPIRTANCYISSVEQGKFVLYYNNPAWDVDFVEGFKPILQHWQYRKNYKAQQ